MNQLLDGSALRGNEPRIAGCTKVCAVIGDPIAHSLSPAIHNAAFESLGMDLVYVALRVRDAELAAAIRGLKALGFLGVNVTMPHKSRILPLLDNIEKTAREIGAVNTIARKSDVLWGYNTDGKAAATALTELGSLSGRKALILGAGGAASAIAHQLSNTIDGITILNRTRSKGSRLAKKVRKWGKIPATSDSLNKTALTKGTQRSDLIVNTLPVDVFPVFGECLIQERLIRSDMLIMDANYKPKTDFVSKARSQGAKTTDGLEMLIRQAAVSFKLWTGEDAPIDVMRKAAIEARAGQ